MYSKSEAIDSATSYSIGGGSVVLASMVEIAHYAQAMAIIFGCIIAALRLAYDGVRLYRLWKDKE